MESYAAFIGWTTSGHTGEDVNFYSFGKELPMTKGVRDNIQVGQVRSGVVIVSVLTKQYPL